MSDLTKNMICPCCGNTRELSVIECPHCQARAINDPLVQPDFKLPSLGLALRSALLVALVFIGFIVVWLMMNDMKVIRMALVWLFGDSTTFTATLLKGDPDLLRYRIFTFDAYRLASIFSIGAIPLTLFALWKSGKALRQIRQSPAEFGGKRIVVGSMISAVCLFLAFSAAGISAIPRAIQNGKTKHIAEVQANFYHLHVQALKKYHRENGTYPRDLADVQGFGTEPFSTFDYWGNPIDYTPTALIASKQSTPMFSNYQLVSPGPDGKLDTEDDIRMIDGVIVSAPDNTDPFTGFFATSKSK